MFFLGCWLPFVLFFLKMILSQWSQPQITAELCFTDSCWHSPLYLSAELHCTYWQQFAPRTRLSDNVNQCSTNYVLLQQFKMSFLLSCLVCVDTLLVYPSNWVPFIYLNDSQMWSGLTNNKKHCSENVSYGKCSFPFSSTWCDPTVCIVIPVYPLF